ncbi:acyl-CoA thioesterase [Fulvivirga kasyanovii]|uniref:Acyl-CoA thioesterase n=1 Tax=Fulvivirga kasyanovii TaxID=396812 RepID=A0ABW9RNF9_9BACT|nr:acyl-CoA thioesterase [Fulvivirga kasyanovii]MTI25664.1 acyl-CoA thioesterase [Fulvivirga kasyanovii]
MLKDTTEIRVRFNEIDSMGILWHGHYIKYFEDGRESFGRAYNLGYLDVYEDHGFTIPIVKVDCNYKKPVKYNDPVVLETTFVDTPAAKIIFDYKLYHADNQEVYATGRSVQVFLNKQNQLQLTVPEFFQSWKAHWNVLSLK